MSSVSIKKISIDKIKFYDVTGTIDTNEKSIHFNVSYEKLKEIFDIDIQDLLFGSDKIYEKTKNIYLYDEKNIPYSCINCIFSYFTKEQAADFNSTTIDVILENTLSDLDDIKTNKVIFKTNYLGRSIHSSYIKGYSFPYDSTKKIIVDTINDANFNINITIESKKEYSYFKLSKIIYTYLEMLFLIFGDMPTITEIRLLEKGKEVKLHFHIVDKYNPIYKKRNGLEILGTITNQSINKANMKKFEEFRKKTKIIYDLLMINVNSEGYIEMKNCNLIHIMEGMYKTLNNITGGPPPTLTSILKHYFEDYKILKKILSRRDKRKAKATNIGIFIYKANNHRNYLSHLNLNENKNVFYKSENHYAYWKLLVSIRLYILEYLDIKYEKDNLYKYIENIEKWTKDKKMRFSSRHNS